MKKLCFFFLLFVLPWFSNAQNKSTQKHGLIIAISKYPYASGWMDINCVNDIALVKSALLSQKFEEKNIKVLEDSAATKQGIEKAFGQLYQKSKAGDYIVIHYSGHGQQISDNNQDEIDGFDEALVAYGAPARPEKGSNYKGEKHLRDDEFGQWIEKLRSKVGETGQILVTIDACHSGSSTRGKVKVRGGEEPYIVPGGDNELNQKDESGSGMISENTEQENPKGKAPYIVMTATQFNELDYETYDDEGNAVGPLSYALAKTFTDIKETDSYLSVFARISAIMAKKVSSQTPTIEGDYNYKVFNGETVSQQPYYTISQKNSMTKVKLNAGIVNGLNNGDKVGLYKSGTQSADDAEPVVTGVVTDAANFSCYVKLDKEYNVKYTNNYWVFVEEYNVKSSYGINLDGLKHAGIKLELEKLFAENPLTSVEDKNAKLAIEEKNNGFVIKHVATGGIFSTIKKPATYKQINKSIKQYAQAQFIKNLNLQDENYQLKLEMVPVVPELDSYGELQSDNNSNYKIKDTLAIETLLKNGKVHVGKDTHIMLKITNIGKKDAYFNIIEIQPDGVITPVMPQEESHAVELFVKAGQSVIPSNFIVAGYYPPCGTEMYKVFATPKPINLTPIITKRAVNTKGKPNDIERVVLGSYGTTRGNNTQTVNRKESGSTYEYTFIIKE